MSDDQLTELAVLTILVGAVVFAAGVVSAVAEWQERRWARAVRRMFDAPPTWNAKITKRKVSK